MMVLTEEQTGGRSQVADALELLLPLTSEAEFVISAIEAGPAGAGSAQPALDRRRQDRYPYRVRAAMRLYSDSPDAEPWELFTRRVNARSLDFVSQRFVPLSHGGTVSLIGPGDQILSIPCTILRCRQAGPGWFDGAVYFNREQKDFDALAGREE